MGSTYFETFMVGGVGLLTVAMLSIAWLLWRGQQTRHDAVKLALEGIGHEFRFNLHQAVRDTADLGRGLIRSPHDLPALDHPQLNGVMAQLINTDKRAFAALQATYGAIEARMKRVRLALADGDDTSVAVENLQSATIDGICTLYLWEAHEGRAPDKVRTTRSRWVRDWMKSHGFEQDLLPGLALRDEVVEHLRASGMRLTPKPLTLTAHEYYSRSYDRSADPRGSFGARKLSPAVEESEGEEWTGPEDKTEADPALGTSLADVRTEDDGEDETASAGQGEPETPETDIDFSKTAPASADVSKTENTDDEDNKAVTGARLPVKIE